MDAIKLLEYLEEIIETSSKVPMTGKVIIHKKECLEIVQKVKKYLPDELKKAQWIVDEKERILSEAIQEAENLKKENINLLRRQIENHNITKEANIRAEEIISSAQRNAKSIRIGTRDYAIEILNELEKEVSDKKNQMLLQFKKEVDGFFTDFDSNVNLQIDTIKQNIKELRDIK